MTVPLVPAQHRLLRDRGRSSRSDRRDSAPHGVAEDLLELLAAGQMLEALLAAYDDVLADLADALGHHATTPRLDATATLLDLTPGLLVVGLHVCFVRFWSRCETGRRGYTSWLVATRRRRSFLLRAAAMLAL